MTTESLNTEIIWQELKAPLWSFIISKVKNDDDANDILQETFIKIHLHINTLKNPTRLKSWAFQIARNCIQDNFRKKRYPLDIEKVEVAAEPVEDNSSCFSDCMLPYVDKLPPKYREALQLSDLKQLSQKKVASDFKLSYSGLKSRVQRARRMLRSYLNACCEIKSDKYGNILSHVPKGNCLCS